MTHEALQESSSNNRGVDRGTPGATSSASETNEDQASSSSTLIEFPGATRGKPEWRKQLSQRVREVQDRKAREAAEELAAAIAAGTVSCELPSGQLELVPDMDQPAMNPIVSKALERLERARRADAFSGQFAAAAAPALAPVDEIHEEIKPKLTIVASPFPLLSELEESEDQSPPTTDRRRKAVRVIREEDALSYLDTCLSVSALAAETRSDVAGFARRITAGAFDLLLVALMVSPVVAAIQYSGGRWSDERVLELVASVTAITMFAYFTISIALTGRTLAMRIFSLRTIDLRTGLIPTGGQSIKRAIAYVFSLAFLGLGLFYAFIDPDHRTVHDRFSKTIVVRG